MSPRVSADNRRKWFTQRYRLTDKQSRSLTLRFMNQIANCKTEECKRILLGSSK
jgi:hypothetical protein